MPRKGAGVEGDHEGTAMKGGGHGGAGQPVEGKRMRPAPGALSQIWLEAASSEVAAGRKRKQGEQAGGAVSAADPKGKRGPGRPRKTEVAVVDMGLEVGGLEEAAPQAKQGPGRLPKARVVSAVYPTPGPGPRPAAPAAGTSTAPGVGGSARAPSQKLEWWKSASGAPSAGGAGAAGQAMRKPGPAAAPLQSQRQQEAVQPVCVPADKRASAGRAAPAAAQAAPAAGAHGRRSPTPVAAAAVLEMSRPTSPAAGTSPEAEELSYRECGDPTYAANTWLMSRLRDPRSHEAQGAVLRPQLQAVHNQLLANLENTIERGHNSSLLLLGPRGSGKTLVAERAIRAVCGQHNTNPQDPLVGVVRLLGYAHADDRVAFREIARQLCETFGYPYVNSASVQDNMEFLRKMLKQLHRADKVVVFVLDDFDLFAKRAKQAVLYNLLDSLQTSGMQAAVMGLTSRFDVIDMLEKRVKSRFSHRVLGVTVPTALAPRAVRLPGGGEGREDGMLDVLKSMLLLPTAFPDRHYAQRFNGAVEAAVGAHEVGAELAKAMSMAPNDPSPGSSNCATLEHLAIVVEGALRASYLDSSLLTARHLVESVWQLQALPRGNVLAVAGLPVLELLLLAAMQRLVASGKAETLNFEMAHQEFRGYSSQGGHSDSYTRAAAAKAFDHLITQGLVAFADSRSEGWAAARQYAPVYLQLTADELLQGMREHGNCPPQLHSWLTKQAGAGNTATMLLH